MITRLRRIGVEPEDVEVKEAAGGLPSTVVDTLSAFANGSGGTLLPGLSESDGFFPVHDVHVDRVREAPVDACSNKLVPAIRSTIEVLEFNGGEIIRLARNRSPRTFEGLDSIAALERLGVVSLTCTHHSFFTLTSTGVSRFPFEPSAEVIGSGDG